MTTSEQLLPLLYYEQKKLPYELVPSSFFREGLDPSNQEKIESQLAEIATGADRIWAITAIANINPHGFPQSRNKLIDNVESESAVRLLLDKHFEPVEAWTSTGIHLVLYDVPEESE